MWIEIAVQAINTSGLSSPSSQRVWIEIIDEKLQEYLDFVTLFTEGVDWNKKEVYIQLDGIRSPSSQRVWIEIKVLTYLFAPRVVTLFTEGVDWNRLLLLYLLHLVCHPLHRGCGLKFWILQLPIYQMRSPSSQRVWIEIIHGWRRILSTWSSPSSQRVWIEIYSLQIIHFSSTSHPLHRGCGLKYYRRKSKKIHSAVTLFTEGVDWNAESMDKKIRYYSHPLHRGCGLKCYQFYSTSYYHLVTLFTEGVDWNYVELFIRHHH